MTQEFKTMTQEFKYEYYTEDAVQETMLGQQCSMGNNTGDTV